MSSAAGQAQGTAPTYNVQIFFKPEALLKKVEVYISSTPTNNSLHNTSFQFSSTNFSEIFYARNHAKTYANATPKKSHEKSHNKI